MKEGNPNIMWAATFVAELAASGLTAVCIAPGSRSTPLTLAFAAHPRVRVYHHIDERCAAFFALGLALATDVPVALVCTSGTATANFHPAVIEAHQSMVPLLVLTGDRPHELRHSGANQTIDQVKMFGDHVLWSVDMGVPELAAPVVALNNTRATAARAFATSNGAMSGLHKGPVHVNFPFRKPLEPSDPQKAIFNQEDIFDEKEMTAAPRTTILQGRLTPTPNQVDDLAAVINHHEKGLIVCGPRCPGYDFPQAIARLSALSGYPIMADPLSGVRFELGGTTEQARIVSHYETFLATGAAAQPFDPPDVVLRFGAVPTSKWLNGYLEGIAPQHRIHVRENGVWADDSHRTTLFLQANETVLCAELEKRIAPRTPPTEGGEQSWAEGVLQVEAQCRNATVAALADADFDVAYLTDLVEMLPKNARLFVGNSLPIRHLDQFCGPTDVPFKVFGNRGASGIDGTVSCALGMAAAGPEPLVLVLGDVTFAHDLNGLLAVGQLSAAGECAPITIVVFNNGGGGIFRRLPIAKFEPPFEELFLTPHNLDFGPIVQGYGWAFDAVDNSVDNHIIDGDNPVGNRVDSRNLFGDIFRRSVTDSTPRVIEVRTNGATDLTERSECCQRILGPD